ncbi:MAG: hypothetical protein QOD00_223 [Blastocatellia bacterium]|jgi:hypothetical protein|nr:hypothetical protein [Blastocatellia bacterium]
MTAPFFITKETFLRVLGFSSGLSGVAMMSAACYLRRNARARNYP